jgi:hypothetical protein
MAQHGKQHHKKAAHKDEKHDEVAEEVEHVAKAAKGDSGDWKKLGFKSKAHHDRFKEKFPG